MRTILLFAFAFQIHILSAQWHDQHWLGCINRLSAFPPYTATYMDFSTSPPTMGAYIPDWVSAGNVLMMSDSMGNPIFTTNGYSLNHYAGGLMENGDTLTPGVLFTNYHEQYSQEFMLCLPMYRSGEYHLFHLNVEQEIIWGRTFQLYHSKIVDAYSASEGRVEYKNDIIPLDSSLSYLAACRHANGRDWWLTLAEGGENGRYVYKSLYFNGDTIYTAQELATIIEDKQIALGFSTGQKKFSLDGKRYADRVSYVTGDFKIFDFDRCTGELSNLYQITTTDTFYNASGLSFSPNNRFLYRSSNYHLLQYDLWDAFPEESVDTVATFEPTLYQGQYPWGFAFHYLQNGSDGKIYSIPAGAQYISYIERPNKKGKACNVVISGLYTPYGTESVPRYPNYRLGPIDNSPCDTLGYDNHPLADFWWFVDPQKTGETLLVEFENNSAYEPTTWSWDFGDGAFSSDTSPSHVFPSAGIYTVCLEVCNAYSCDTICKDVTVGGTPTYTPVQEQDGLSAQLFPNPAHDFFQILYTLPKGSGNFVLYDAQGKIVQNINLKGNSGNRILPLQGLSSGLYVYVLADAEGRTVSGKLVVE